VGGNPNISLPKTTWEPSLALHFGNVCHLWALPIIKHKLKVMYMNLNIYVDHEVEEGRVFAYTP
jgi:hypothetical protein